MPTLQTTLRDQMRREKRLVGIALFQKPTPNIDCIIVHACIAKFPAGRLPLYKSLARLPLFQRSDTKIQRCLFCARGVESSCKLEGWRKAL